MPKKSQKEVLKSLQIKDAPLTPMYWCRVKYLRERNENEIFIKNNIGVGVKMSEKITFTIDGVKTTGKPGQTILEAADDAGIYIPRLCQHPELVPHGSCRVCTVLVNGRPQTACTQPVAEGMIVENNTKELDENRRDIIDMLFIEGNHFCMFCEKSGNCEL